MAAMGYGHFGRQAARLLGCDIQVPGGDDISLMGIRDSRTPFRKRYCQKERPSALDSLCYEHLGWPATVLALQSNLPDVFAIEFSAC